MPQGAGFYNTAPSPIPGGYGNPAGANIGLPSASPGSGVPMPVGSIPTNLNPTTATQLPQSMFPANTGGAIPVGVSNLNTGMKDPNSPWFQNLYNELGRAYGKGTGQMLGDMLSKGLFNPQVAQALMQAMEPSIARGYNDVLGAFGSEGARFSSAAAIGAGDYMSQARLGQTAQLAQLWQNAQTEQLSLLENVLPTLHTEEANRGSGVLSDILGGLEIVGGAIAAPFSGGASLGLLTSGISTIAAGNKGGGGGGSSSPSSGGSNPLSSLLQLFKGGASSSSPANISGGVPQVPQDLLSELLSSSAGSTIGGSDSFNPLAMQY